MDMAKLDTHTETLLTPLTDAEWTQRANALARACQDIGSLEAKHADMKAQMKADLTRLEAERDRLALIVNRKAENREVAVTAYADYTRAEVSYVREDSGEIVRTRPMDDKERQTPLPMEG